MACSRRRAAGVDQAEELARRTTSSLVPCYHETMTKNLTVRLDDELAADTEALARAEGTSLNETVKRALIEAVERRRDDPEFKVRLRRIIEEDRELLERLAK
jgi:predicted HicB family RNase H-like nuclease